MKGFSVRQIPVGKPGAGTKVVRLHYSADPNMTPERVAQLKSQYPDVTMWDREMEIDDSARGGQKVFPGFDESIHVVPPFLPLRKEDWTTWLACDPHPRRAHAFVFLCVNKYGEMVVPWSYWPEEVNKQRDQQGQSRILIREYAEDLASIVKAGMFPDSHIELMDSAGKNFNADEEDNFFDRYQQHGLIFTPAKKNREYAGYDLIEDALTPKKWTVGNIEVMKPTLTIMAGCGDNDILAFQMKQLRWKELTGEAVVNKDAPGQPVDKDHHLVDCVSYILLDGPRFIDRSSFGGLDPGDDPNIPRAHG